MYACGGERNVLEVATALGSGPKNGSLPETDSDFLVQLRAGDAEAGHRFIRDYYPAVYRYLLSLTGHRETAEDLTQETFLQAWRHLDQFQERAPLRLWLHQIARREFLRARRYQRPAISLDEVAEFPETHLHGWTDEVELRVLLSRLPEEQQEAMILHTLEGYSSSEIARITQAPASTVRDRLRAARARLARALGPGDLPYLNEPAMPMRQWAWLPLDQMHALETRLSLGGVRRSGTRAAGGLGVGTGCRTPNTPSEATTEEKMERREFLRQAAVGAAGLMLSDADKEIVDSRLTQKVTCAFKGTALADLCEKLRSDTGVQLSAGPSVADEKVTHFCEKLPLRDAMRQLSRPFGYTWLRSRKEGGEYRYELVQDLRSQLLEEELRNRDRNAALLALESEIDRFRPYLSLFPDEALAKAKSAPAAERPLLEKLSGVGWGPIHMYFRLSPQEQAALRAGQTLTFSGAPDPGELPLPSDMARGVLQSFRYLRVHKTDDPKYPAIFLGGGAGEAAPGDLPLPEVPDVRTSIWLSLGQSELGQFTLNGGSRVFFPKAAGEGTTDNPYAVGRSPATLKPDNHAANIKLAAEPSLRARVTFQPQPSCGVTAAGSAGTGPQSHGATRRASEDGEPEREPKVTTADALEALHRATGVPMISDFYTRLYKPEVASAKDRPLFDVLNDVGDAMRLRWRKNDTWLQFRSTTFYDDRRKEVPNRLLTRWATSRRQQGMLTLDELVEIAQLPDAELDGDEMAEGAKECWGLTEWDLARDGNLRPHLRFLASFTPQQRQEVLSTAGLPFTRMTLAQQKQFIEYVTLYDRLDFDALPHATMRVEYTQPGWFQWANPALAPHWMYYMVVVEPGRDARWVPRPRVRERTREAVIEAVRRLDPMIQERALHTGKHPEPPVPLEAQVFPSELNLTFVYISGASNGPLVHIIHRSGGNWQIPGL
jgi:RNA polymerase sigma-70 factor, ECF subfamily